MKGRDNKMEKKKLSVSTGLCYAGGDVGCNIVFGMIGTLLTLFYTDYVGISAATVGLVMLLIGYNKTFPQIGDALTPVLRYTTIFLFCGTPIIGWGSSLIALKFYRLDKKKMNEIAAALQEEEIE